MTEPKIRFKRDDGSAFPDWEEKTLGDITAKIERKSSENSNAPVMMISQGNGFIYQADKYSRENAGQSLKKYTLLRRGEFAYNHGASKAKPYGVTYVLQEEDEARVPFVYHTFEIIDGINAYWHRALNTSQMDRQLKKLVSSGVRMDGLLNINYDTYMDVTINVPSLPEQQKIADFLSDVDAVIAASEEEVANLEQQKKAVMQKIFSQEVRFKKEDGSDFPDWEETTILDLLIQPITDGPHETPILVEEGVPFVSVEAVENGRINLLKRRGNITKEYDSICAKKYKPQLYDVYMVKSGATTGKLAIVTTEDDFNIWSPLAAMRTASKTEAFFLFYLLQSDILQKQVWTKLSLGNQPNLGMRALEAFDAVRPCLEEQQLIAEFLTSYDDAITAAKHELEKWKELKNGLLQQMFV